MHAKALLFGDEAIAQAILDTSSPRKIRSLGRNVQNFSDKVWKRHREQIVYENNVAKFQQNESMRAVLLATGDRVLVEASPSDSIWGIGLHERDAVQCPANQWPGLNLLGKALMRVRDTLRAINDEEEESAVAEEESGVVEEISSASLE